jgi:hypothetical protein
LRDSASARTTSANDIDDFNKTRAGKFIEAAHAKFDPLILELIPRGSLMMISMAKGSCQTTEQISFESGVRTSAKISLSRSFSGNDPESKAAVKVMYKFFEVGSVV